MAFKNDAQRKAVMAILAKGRKRLPDKKKIDAAFQAWWEGSDPNAGYRLLQKLGYKKSLVGVGGGVLIGSRSVIKAKDRGAEFDLHSSSRLREYLHNMKSLRRVLIPRVLRHGKGWFEVQKISGKGSYLPDPLEDKLRSRTGLGEDLHSQNVFKVRRGNKTKYYLIDLDRERIERIPGHLISKRRKK